jgi:hypothetical protein
MSKSVIAKWFYGSLIGLVGGLVLLGVAGGLAVANHVFITNGSDVTGVRSSALGWTLLGIMGFGILVICASAVAQFVAWIGAVLNTAGLPDKGWFIVLLVVGLLGFPFIVTLIYVITGPDESSAARVPGQPARAIGGEQPVTPPPGRLGSPQH